MLLKCDQQKLQKNNNLDSNLEFGSNKKKPRTRTRTVTERKEICVSGVRDKLKEKLMEENILYIYI